ncbi:MAG: BBP7 family outer membrane beta-barrel protein [bacterium]|nr:BBP7 family outer membrane beta-barrel protein [bacterium]
MKNLIASLVVVSLLAAQAAAQNRSSYPSANQRTAAQRPTAGNQTSAARMQQRKPRPNSDSRVVPAGHISARPISTSQTIIEGGEYLHGGEYVEGEYIVDPPIEYSGGCDSCGGGGCNSCDIGASYCDSCNAPNRFCLCFPSHGWVHAEYLLWFQSGMRVPALVTTSPAGTARADAGVLGRSGTSVLYGATEDLMGSDAISGVRIRFGWWLSNFPCWGVEGEYTGLGDTTENFIAQSTGNPILARPFFNALDGRQDSELVAFPDVVSGTVGVSISSRFDGAAARFRKQFCGSSGCCFSQLACRSVPYSSRLDGTIGYRFWELAESIDIREQLQLLGNENGSFDILDHFDTRNLFNGVELGVLWQGRRGCWTADALMRLGIGNVNQLVTINGRTQTIENGVGNTFDQGFLVQETNSGSYSRDKFTMIPELGVNVGYQLTKRLRATLGWTSIYWGNVVRPGDQIDLDVNPNLLPPSVDPRVPLRPQFQFVETDYWVHGLSFGGEFRW